MEQFYYTLAGGVVGFLLPYTSKTLEKYVRSSRIKSALLNEGLGAKAQLRKKLDWLSRDVSQYPDKVDAKRVSDCEGKKLYLGEKETFDVNCRYWNEKYCDIAEFLSKEEFAFYGELNGNITDFKIKFGQMKAGYESPYGDPHEMACACYRDLIEIYQTLEKQLPGR